jgi:hypothetical protein
LQSILSFGPNGIAKALWRRLVLEYYWLLRSMLRAKPERRACLTRCRQCRIFFLTHPRNAQQRDKVRCPFGYRKAHGKQASTRRSLAYYRDPDVGREKKAALNQRRNGTGSTARTATAVPKVSSAKKHPLIVDHVRMVVSRFEGRTISRREVLRMLATILRQHSMCRVRQIDHAVAWLKKHPPWPRRHGGQRPPHGNRF